MPKDHGWACTVLAALAVAGCGGGGGGGGGGDRPTRFQAGPPNSAPTAAVDNESVRADELLDLAESSYSALFPSHRPSEEITIGATYRYRFYPETGIYLGVDKVRNGQSVYALGGPFGATLIRLGPLTDYVSSSHVTVVRPGWMNTSSWNGFINDDSIWLGPGALSNDGLIVVFASWSKHRFGQQNPFATSSCSYEYIYKVWGSVQGTAELTLLSPQVVSESDGGYLCGYESSAAVSGDGSKVFFRGIHKPYVASTQAVSGIFRWPTEGRSGYVPVSIKGIETSSGGGGSVQIGEVFLGVAGDVMADTDGNSVVFTMSQLKNAPDGVSFSYDQSLYANPMLRMDQGARAAANQDQGSNHGSYKNGTTFDVSGNGTIVIYSESVAGGQGKRVRAWDMLARKDAGDLFVRERALEPSVAPVVCGISADGRYVLVEHGYDVPLDPFAPTVANRRMSRQLSRYDRVNGTFLFVGVSEDRAASIGAGCSFSSFLGHASRQMSKDGNIVAWRFSDHFYVRDVTAQRTVKISQKGPVRQWILSGDGSTIALLSSRDRDGVLLADDQLFKYMNIDTSAGAISTIRSLESKIEGRQVAFNLLIPDGASTAR